MERRWDQKMKKKSRKMAVDGDYKTSPEIQNIAGILSVTGDGLDR